VRCDPDGILNFDTKVAAHARWPGVTGEPLYGFPVPGAPVNEHGFGASPHEDRFSTQSHHSPAKMPDLRY
jgi:hypothetical protein